MIESHAKEVLQDGKNTILKRTLHLGYELSCHIVLSSESQNQADVVMNHILDFTIDKISQDNTYKDFSITLENINGLLNTWSKNEQTHGQLDIAVCLVYGSECMFAAIGKSCVLFVNKDQEIIEITDKKENKQNFSYISTGSLAGGEYIILGSTRLLDYLSQSDILESTLRYNDNKQVAKNIADILNQEILPLHISFEIIKYNSPPSEIILSKQSFQNKVSQYSKKLKHSEWFKKIQLQYNKWNIPSKTSNNVLFLVGITLAIIFLYSILSTAVGVTNQSEVKETAKQNIITAKDSLRLASENIGNQDTFSQHIKDAESILQAVEKEKLFLNDIEKMYDDINILKKQFNKIELFTENADRLIYQSENTAGVKILKKSLKPYLINKKSVTGPLIGNNKAKTYSFNELKADEEFIDGVLLGDNIYLLTNTSKVVEFSKNMNFRFVDVSGQNKWQNAKQIQSYGQNIYLLGKSDNQIFRHRLALGTFGKADAYLLPEDSKKIGEILSIAIDGGFYILKNDLSIVKFFSNPKYRMESIVINKLPKNYSRDDQSSTIQLKTRKGIKYVYLLMNNKIWVFKPNTTNFKNTQSLTYIGQIEGERETITDFYINYDGEILILNKNGIYKMNFEISDDTLRIL